MSTDVTIYARVSTEDQDLTHQEENLWEYATDRLGYDSENVTILRDKSTGTNTDRSGYKEMLELVRNEETDVVVVREITRIGRSLRDISETVFEIVEDYNVGLYVMNDDLEIPPGEELSMQDKMYLNVLAWGAELEAKKIKENTIAGLRAAEEAGKHVGRPPYGFTTNEDGYLQPNENFNAAVNAIHAVEDLGWSKRKTSEQTGVPRRTIPTLIENKERYLNEYEAPDTESVAGEMADDA